MAHASFPWIERVPTPSYVIDLAKLKENLAVLHDIEETTGAHVLLAQALERRRDRVERKRKTTAQIERRGVVVESQCPDGHAPDYKIRGAIRCGLVALA